MHNLIPPHLRALMIATLAAVVLAGCAAPGPTIRSDYDRNADFDDYQTFGYVDPLGTDKTGYSTLITAHFKAATREQMEALGYRYSEQSPDLLVNFFSNTEHRSDVRSRPSVTAAYGYYGYRSGLYLGLPLYGEETETRHYKVGTMNVDVVDAAKDQVVWQGVAEGKLTEEDLQNPRSAIQSAVQQMFQRFPTRREPQP